MSTIKYNCLTAFEWEYLNQPITWYEFSALSIISLGEKGLLLSKAREEWRDCFVLLGMQEEVSNQLLQPRYAQEHPCMTALYSFSDGCFQKYNTISRSSYQLRMMMSSLYSDQSTDPNRAALGCDGTGHLRCTAPALSCQSRRNVLGNVSST